jgi:hypothetical protein
MGKADRGRESDRELENRSVPLFMKNDYKALIDAERIKLNDRTADFNNLQAALASGLAVYVVHAERAIGDQILGCKGKATIVAHTHG